MRFSQEQDSVMQQVFMMHITVQTVRVNVRRYQSQINTADPKMAVPLAITDQLPGVHAS